MPTGADESSTNSVVRFNFSLRGRTRQNEKIHTFRAAKTLSYVRVLQIEEPFRELKAYSSDDLFVESAKNSSSLPTRQTAGEKKPHECGFFLIS
jgi:hypothetical protein